MALKDEWKETGKGLGQAFAGLGKNIGRSAKTIVDSVTGKDKEEAEKAKDIEEGVVDEVKEEAEKDSTVFNDGSWRNTGKDLGNAFVNLGKSILHSGKEGVDKLSDAVDGDKEKEEEKKEETTEEQQ